MFLRVGKVLHAGKLLNDSSLHSFNRFNMLFYIVTIHKAYSKWDLTKLLYRGTNFTPFSDTYDCHNTTCFINCNVDMFFEIKFTIDNYTKIL